MSIKKYVLLVISDQPLGLGCELIEKISGDPSTQHFIYEELELEPTNKGMRAKKELPSHSSDEDMILEAEGVGASSSMVITSFLVDMVHSVFEYKPHYKKTETERGATVEKMLETDEEREPGSN
ncbi:MAG: hypothetical protein Athens071416_399 [Parcubacteria group bacterium Athens0714_16]|nr:MAG: hypothetical protein Athens071416_399 [Parcubacteria group bacterium Athens0714_16]